MAIEFLRLNLPPRPSVNTGVANQFDCFLKAVTGIENHLVGTAIFWCSHDFVMKDDEDLHFGNQLAPNASFRANTSRSFRDFTEPDDTSSTTLGK
jgi:hypothetical protein